MNPSPPVALFFLPTLHVIACVTIWIARLQSGVHYLIYVDFPCSLLLVMAGWRNDSFLFWFATLGTAWWYGLSYIGWRLLKA